MSELTSEDAPDLARAFTVGPDADAEMLIVPGQSPERIRSEVAFARLSCVAPIPASSEMTTRHRINRGGHRQSCSALYRAVIVHMQHHEPTRAYAVRGAAEGKMKSAIIRCLKRPLACEVWAARRTEPPLSRRERIPSPPLDRLLGIYDAMTGTHARQSS